MHMQWSMKHVLPQGGYGLCSLWEIAWYTREQCLSNTLLAIKHHKINKFCACAVWMDTITWGITKWPCWNCTIVDGKRCQHWSHYRGIIQGKCILVNNSWMVALWSGEHLLGLLIAYANEGVGHWSWYGRPWESWCSIPKCHNLNVLILWCSCVMGFDGWKYKKRIEM